MNREYRDSAELGDITSKIEILHAIHDNASTGSTYPTNVSDKGYCIATWLVIEAGRWLVDCCMLGN